jgi:hypothetical protein
VVGIDTVPAVLLLVVVVGIDTVPAVLLLVVVVGIDTVPAVLLLVVVVGIDTVPAVAVGTPDVVILFVLVLCVFVLLGLVPFPTGLNVEFFSLRYVARIPVLACMPFASRAFAERFPDFGRVDSAVTFCF